MSRNVSRTGAGTRRRTSRRTLLLIGLAIVVVVVLLVLEQVALLYVLATLGVAALLTVVAFADLGGAKRTETGPAPYDDAASIASGGISPDAGAAASFGPNAPRKVKGQPRR